jgi:hypothetical protein
MGSDFAAAALARGRCIPARRSGVLSLRRKCLQLRRAANEPVDITVVSAGKAPCGLS